MLIVLDSQHASEIGGIAFFVQLGEALSIESIAIASSMSYEVIELRIIDDLGHEALTMKATAVVLHVLALEAPRIVGLKMKLRDHAVHDVDLAAERRDEE